MRYLTMIIALLAVLAVLAVSACSLVTEDYDDSYGAGYVDVNENEWAGKYNTPYPFTVADGEISCGLDPQFGRTVYFEPVGFTDESYIGTPLNQAAAKTLKHADMRSNVPYSIKAGVDLSVAVNIGLKACDEQQEFLKSNG